jgi:hypothetical protein
VEYADEVGHQVLRYREEGQSFAEFDTQDEEACSPVPCTCLSSRLPIDINCFIPTVP